MRQFFWLIFYTNVCNDNDDNNDFARKGTRVKLLFVEIIGEEIFYTFMEDIHMRE